MSKKSTVAFLAGLGQGVMSSNRRRSDDARQEKEDEWRDEQRQFQREQQQSARQERIALSDAVAPRTVVEGTAVDTPAGPTLYKDPAQAQAAAGEAQIEAEMRGTPPLGAPRPAYGTTGMSLGNQITTEKPDVAALNSPDARMGRVVDATMRTDPAKAISLQSAALGIKNTQEQMDDRRKARVAAVKREGLEGTFRAMQTRDPEAVFKAFNSQGDTKLEGPPQLVGTQKTKTPWGEIDDDVWSATVVGPDGSKRQIKMSTLQVGQQLASVSDMLADQREVGKSKLKLENDITLEGVRSKNNLTEIGARGGEDRRTVDHRKRTGADKAPVSREERMRYTTLFNEAGRRMSDSQKALNTLLNTSGRRANTPGTPENEQAMQLREAIGSYGEERKVYQGMLVDSQSLPGGNKLKPGDAPKPAVPALPKGAKQVGTHNGRPVYETEDGKRYIKN